jgi:aminomethyltransferase
MGQRTPLFDAHVAAGAKIVDFAGWDMPIHYGSQLEEHHLVRRACGLFDVSHMRVVDLSGPACRPYLSKLLANDVAKLASPGRALYSCMLNDAGGVIDDLIVYHFADDRFRLVVNAGTADKDIAWMRAQAQAFGTDLAILPRPDLALIAVQGPTAPTVLFAAVPGSEAVASPLKSFHAAWLGDDVLIARTGYTGEDGFELMLPATRALEVWNALLAAGGKPAGLGARDTLRLEAGMNLYGQDMDETVTPLEAGLAWTVDLKNPSRAFIGRAALKVPPPRVLVGLLLIDRGVLRAHQKVITAQGEGETTSGSFAPTLNASVAFARVPLGISPGDVVDVEIRDKRLKAKVVKPPFARNGKAQVN